MLAYRHEDRGPVKAWMLREWIKELKNQLDGKAKN
jgi:hypothetical protein